MNGIFFRNNRSYTWVWGALLGVFFVLASGAVMALPAVITEPEMVYGLGLLEHTAYSPNANVPLVATCGGAGAVLWNAQSGERVRVLRAPGHYTLGVAISPDGSKVLTGGWDATAKLWDAASGELIRTFSGHTKAVWSVAFSPDGSQIITGSGDNTAKIWNTATGVVNHTLSEHIHYVQSVAFSPDGSKVVTGSLDHTAIIWDAATGATLHFLASHTDDVLSVAFSPGSNKVVTGGADNKARLWDVATGLEDRSFSGHTDGVYAVAFSPTGAEILTGSGDGTAKIWNAATGVAVRTLSDHSGTVGSVSFSPDGSKILTGSWDLTAKLWDASTGEVERTLSGHTDSAYAAVFSPDGAKVASSNGYVANLWETATGEEILNFKGHTDIIYPVAYSRNGQYVLTGSKDNSAKLWNAATGAPVHTFANGTGHLDDVYAVALSADGARAATGSGDKNVGIWNTSSGENITFFQAHSSYVNSVAFSPDGTTIATGGSDNEAKLWDAASGNYTLIRSFTGHTGEIYFVAFSPDGSQLLTASGDDTARLWNVADATLLQTFTGHTGDVLSVAFSPDGAKIATASEDFTAMLWDPASGEALRTFKSHTDWVWSVAFSPDGASLLTAGMDGMVFLWDSGLAPQGGANPISARTKNKVLLVAGGGPYAGNAIADQTKALAELTYLTAQIRGYGADDIQYLSAFETPAQNPDVDAFATSAAIDTALNTWSADAARLTIFLLDHGVKDSQIPEWYFLVDGVPSTRDRLSATDLDALLDTLQSGNDPLTDLTLYVDMCYASGFVGKCSGAPTNGARRTVIASTTDSRLASFGSSDGSLSFTAFFLSSALKGNSYYDCFASAREAIMALNVPASAPQLPWLDDDGDGRPTSSDGAIARGNVLGNNPALGFKIPQITSAKANAQIAQAQDFEVWCDLGPGKVKTVSATITYAKTQYAAGQPITNHTVVNLQREGATSRWSATAPASTFIGDGTYHVLYAAHHDDSFGLNLDAVPAARTLIVGALPAQASPNAWVLYE